MCRIPAELGVFGSGSLFWGNDFLTIIISAVRADMMGKFWLVAMRTSGDIRRIEFPVRPSFSSSGFGMSSFRQWHFLLLNYSFSFWFTSSVFGLTSCFFPISNPAASPSVGRSPLSCTRRWSRSNLLRRTDKALCSPPYTTTSKVWIRSNFLSPDRPA